ncbi:MAG TPA: tRNA lysidine(34) synthetase TilS [Pyrinomonadaceae bacterium]
MHKFVRNLLTEWRRFDLPFAGETFVAAVSGGADSISLLLALEELRCRKKITNRLVVAHFNHNLRGAESEKDAEFVKALCAKFNFELALKIQDSSFKIQDKKGSLEQNARRARYEFLVEIAENLRAHAVFTAHTINDQAETFLINLLRGSGLPGLSGMKAVRSLQSEQSLPPEAKSEIGNRTSEILLIRPLLKWARRDDTENYCRARQIEPRYDSMNEDLAFQRVRVRKILLPMLAEFNPKIVETLANTAEVLRRENEFLNEQKERIVENISFQSSEISAKELKKMPRAALNHIMRQWLKANRGDLRGLEIEHLAAIERLIFSRKSGRIIELPNGETIVKENGKLSFKK